MQKADNKQTNEIEIKTLCEYLFFDQFQDTATFPKFEQCFQPLFNNIDISMETVFKEICGEKKKYINYYRFAKAYLNHLNGKDPSNDTKTFFTNTLTKILKEENSFVGKSMEKNYIFSTKKSCQKRQCITLIEVLSDKAGKIHGINLEYDGVYKSEMYPSKIKDDLIVSLEMKLGIVDEKPIKEKKVGKFLGFKQENYRDGVTHVFGTINQETGLITFLGFKCLSGKTVFVGFPEGDGFLFGKFGKKLHNLKLQMTVDGITKLEPGFKENSRKNFFLGGIFGKLLNQDLNKEEVIKDEAQLSKLEDDIAIDKLITTPIVDDDHFFNEKLKDEISGNNYKEVVNQFPRHWIRKGGVAGGKRKKFDFQKKPFSLIEALKGYNEEFEKRAPSKIRERLKQFNLNPNQNIPFFPHGFPIHGPLPIGGPHLPLGLLGIHGPIPGPGIFPVAPWLHKTRRFLPPPRPGSSFGFGQKFKFGKSIPIWSRKYKWDGKIEKKTPPSLFFYKHNYLGLKEKLGKMIHDEVSKKSEGNEGMKNILLSQIIPDPGRYKRRFWSFGKNFPPKNFENYKKKDLKEHINIFKEETFSKDMKKKISAKSQNKEDNFKKGEKKTIFSDALEMMNEITDEKIDNSNGNNNDNKEEKKNYYTPYSNNGYIQYKSYGFNNYKNYKNYYTSDSQTPEQQKEESIENNDTQKNIYKKKGSKKKKQQKKNTKKKEEKMEIEEAEDPTKYKEAQEKWKSFRQGLEKINGVYLLQTIGSIIKAMKVLENDIDGKSTLSLSEKVKLYKMLEENEAIVDFLSQNNETSSSTTNQESEIEKENVEDDLEDNVLIPDEHPEQFTSLEELEEKLGDIKKLLQNEKMKKEDKYKIEQLYNLYLQQKNILIENETKAAKNDIINQNNINVNKYIQEEQEKRRKAQEEEEKKIEQIQIEEEAKKKKSEILKSILNQKVPNKIYMAQKMPKDNKPWKDDIFPPEKKSLCPFDRSGWILPEDVWESDVDGWEAYKWCRIEEIYDSKDYTVFSEGANMNDIQQGNIGDCYFLSVLGSLCVFPDFFDKLFYIKEKTEEHAYGVYIYINGKWELVLVDDYFPYEGMGFKQFAFSNSSGNEMWVSLLEKAWAKVNGSYAKIGCGGMPNEVFDVLTEAYSEQISISQNNKEIIWQKCQDAIQKGYVMTAGTSGDVSNLDLEEVGLTPGHAYSFLNIYKVDTG